MLSNDKEMIKDSNNSFTMIIIELYESGYVLEI